MDRAVTTFNGTVFEDVVARYLSKRFPNAVLIENRELESKFLGKMTQTDLIMVDEHGVFVIEAKNWRGWISGGYNDADWVGQGAARAKLDVKNMVGQNLIHIRSIRNAIRRLGIEPVRFHNIVCTRDGTHLDTDCIEVVNLAMLESTIRALMSKYPVTLTQQQYVDLIMKVTREEGYHERTKND